MSELMPTGGWLGPRKARLSPQPVSERGALFRLVSLFARMFGRKEVPDIFTVFHINARLFWAWLFFASRLMPYGRLPGKLREMIILRTGWNCRSRYEWGQHVDIALSVGVTDETIVRVSQGPTAFAGQSEEGIMRACDEIFADRYISDATWTLLSGKYNNRLLIEITILIGHYIMIAGFLNSAGLSLERPIEEKLQAFHNRIALK